MTTLQATLLVIIMIGLGVVSYLVGFLQGVLKQRTRSRAISLESARFLIDSIDEAIQESGISEEEFKKVNKALEDKLMKKNAELIEQIKSL